LVITVFSLIYGIPAKEILEECRAKSIVTIAAATTSDEAASLQEAGVDAIAASGFEAGGHRGSFLQAAEGAEAVQMGTVFLTCQESGASPLHRQALLRSNVHTALTKGFTGRLARGIRNRLIRYNEDSSEASRSGRAVRIFSLCGPAKAPIFRLAPTYTLS